MKQSFCRLILLHPPLCHCHHHHHQQQQRWFSPQQYRHFQFRWNYSLLLLCNGNGNDRDVGIGRRRWLMSSHYPSSTSTSSLLSPLLRQQFPPSNNSTAASDIILPIHILGSGSIGLLLASAIHDKYQHQHYRYRNPNKCSSENGDANDGEEGEVLAAHPVTILMRSHHKPHLKLLSSSRNENNSNWQCWLANVTIRNGTSSTTTTTTSLDHPPHEETNENSIQQCNNIPVELIEDVANNDSDSNKSNNNSSISAHTTIQTKPTPIHCLVLVTKANDAIPALESVWDTRLVKPSSSLSSSSSPNNNITKMIILSNGALAIRDAIYRRFGSNCLVNPYSSSSSHQDRTLDDKRVQLILATTTHGAHKTHHHPHHQNSSSSSSSSSIGHYDITHAGVGCTTCTDLPFTQLCHSIGWEGECLSMLDMHVMLWKKLAVNCVINPLTAIHNVTNGQLLLDIYHCQGKAEEKEEDIKMITRQILEEVSLVAMMEMQSLYYDKTKMRNEDMRYGNSNSSNNNNTLCDQWLPSMTETLSPSSLEKFVHQVMCSTKDNVSSMLQDVRSGKTTEVQFLNGYVASLGRDKYGIDCPRNLEMCRLVEELGTR